MDVHTYSLDTTWRMLLKDLGIVPATVLRRAGLAEDLLQEANVRLPAADYYGLWQAIEAETPGQSLAVRVCEAVRSETFSPPIFAALCSPNLLIAGRRIAKFKPLIAPIRLEISPRKDTTKVEIRWLDEALAKPVTLVMMELLMSVALARIGTRERIRPVEVTSREPVPLAGQLKTYLGIPVSRGPRNTITFDNADVTRPFLTSNESLWQTFEPALRQRLASLEAASSTAQRVHAVLLEGLPSGLTSIDFVAKRLALSKRTLQRRIEDEGDNYQAILTRTRQSLAQHYLQNTGLSAPEISFLLGFEEPNSFYRAFKTWTGTTPDRARSQFPISTQ